MHIFHLRSAQPFAAICHERWVFFSGTTRRCQTTNTNDLISGRLAVPSLATTPQSSFSRRLTVRRRFKATSYFDGDSKPRHISSAIQSQHVYGDSKPRNILLRATHRPVSSFSTSVAALQPLYDERLIRQASPAAACSRPPFLFNCTSPSPARLVCIDDDCRIFFCAWYIVLDKKTLDFLDFVHWYLYMFFLNRLAFIGRFFLSPTCLHWPVYCHYVCIFIAMQNLYSVPCRMSWCLSSYFCITLGHDNIPLPLTYVQYSLRIPDLYYFYNKQRKGNIPYLSNFVPVRLST